MPGRALAPPLDFLRQLNLELDHSYSLTEQLLGQLEKVSVAGQSGAAAHQSSMQRITDQTSQTEAAVAQSLAAVSASAAAAEGSVASSAGAIRSHAAAAEETVGQMERRILNSTDKQATALDDVLESLHFADLELDYYTESFLSAIEASKAGILDLDEIARVFAEFTLVLDGKATTVQEIFLRLDLRQWIKEFQDLTTRVREGAATLAEVEELLAKSQNSVARRLLEIIQLFRQGAVTLDAVRQVVEDIARVFKDSDLDNLAQAVLAALHDGTV